MPKETTNVVAPKQAGKQADITTLTALADMYEMLAIVLQLPTEDIVAGLNDGSVIADARAILGEMGFEGEAFVEMKADFEASAKALADNPSNLRTLRQEYTRLFSHPENPAIPIFEEQYLWSRHDYKGKPKEKPLLIVNRASLDAERCYRAAGLKRAEDMRISADCMSTEMEFMQHLYVSKARALLDDDDETLVKTDAQIREFTHLHLEKWAKDFFADCATLSTCEVYQAAGLLGGMLVEWQLEQLKSSEADKGDCLPSQEAAQS